MHSCVLNILMDRSPNNCTWTRAKFIHNVYVAENETNWFVISKTKLPVHINCNPKEIFKELEGLMIVRKACVIWSKYFALRSPQTLNSKLKVNWSWTFKTIEVGKLRTPIDSNPILLEVGKSLERLNKTTSGAIDDILKNVNSNWQVQNYHIGVSATVSLILGSILIGALYYVIKRNKKKPSESQMNEILARLKNMLD